MPVEIRELFIKVAVNETGKEKPSAQEGPPPAREALIADCVEEVMRILREEKER